MEQLKSWIAGVCAVSLIISILKTLLPESSVGKTFNIASSLLLIIAIIAPVKELDLEAFRIEVSHADAAMSDKIERISEENMKITDGIIEEKLCEYICTRADIDMDDIDITCHNGEVKKVVVYKNFLSVKKILKDECGITDDLIYEQGV